MIESKILPFEIKASPKHFYSLDIIRGVAALSVVLWHWQHFYFNGTKLPSNFDSSRQPFYSALYVFYTNGAFAVDFFFSLSGFIFFYLYSKKIMQRNISGRDFTILRFSRLYPLHLLTLFVVLILQAIAFYQTGIFKVFPLNNAYHFILNLLFLQSWGLEAGNSYNSPSWSVSVEVFLYGLFFILCWFNLNKKFFIWIIIFLAIGIETVYSPLGQGIFSFFAGGLVYYIYQNLASARDVKRYTRWIGLLASLSMVVMVADVYLQFIENAALLISHHLIKHFTDVQILKIVEATCHLYLKLIVFPLTILFFGLYETLEGSRGKQLAFIGHISYSSYLIHFPLQLLLMDICDEFKLNIGRLADSGITMMLFYLLLIGISLASFHYFELPVQNYIRKKLIRNKKPVALSIPESAACRVNE